MCTIMGRSYDCEIIIDDPLVSKKHCQILFEDDNITDIIENNILLKKFKNLYLSQYQRLNNIFSSSTSAPRAIEINKSKMKRTRKCLFTFYFVLQFPYFILDVTETG